MLNVGYERLASVTNEQALDIAASASLALSIGEVQQLIDIRQEWKDGYEGRLAQHYILAGFCRDVRR